MSARKVLVYGAIADASSSSGRGAIKRNLKTVRDVVLNRFSSHVKIDYRDYETGHGTNVGDIAIGEAVRRQFDAQKGGGYHNINWGQLAALDPDEADAGYRLLIVAGSGYFQFPDQSGRLESDLQFYEKTKLPLVLYGIGVNRPFDKEKGRRPFSPTPEEASLLKSILDRATLIAMRDKSSVELLSEYTSKSIRLIGDPALFFGNDLVARRASEAGTIRVGINFSLHGPLAQSQFQKNFHAYVQVLKQFQKETKCEYFYFMHSVTEHAVPWMLRSHGISVTKVSGDPSTLFQHYADLDFHVGGMLHSCILATGAGTPCIALAYDAKHHGFFDLLGMDEYCHPSTSLTPADVLASMHSLNQRNAEIRAQISDRTSALRTSMQEVVSACGNI